MNTDRIVHFLNNVSKYQAELNNDPEFLQEYFDKACSLLTHVIRENEKE